MAVKIIIDTMTPKLAVIESLSSEHDLKHDASFDSIHIRMIINAQAQKVVSLKSRHSNTKRYCCKGANKDLKI